ncbi:MAG: hypothetical protein DMD91_20235 [Candidatus Rokuibacteriota bacterium]|nr:MAG: hypothetical protein DMD91_20235 [Candidatus Rokubacteria bacterium]
MRARRIVALLALAVITLFTVAADAQLARVGVVATVQGSATLTRTSEPQGVPLKLRDDVFVADRIVTGENSLARILLGGKAVVTVRERSALTISESARTATIDVSTGKIALAVVKERMKAGEQIDIRTPNAVAGIRGTVVITEVSQASAQAGGAPKGFTTTITVLTGTIEVRQLDALTRQPVGAGVMVTASQAIRITGATPPRHVQPITADTRQRLGDEFKLGLKDAPPPPSADQVQQATNALRAPAGAATGSGGSPAATTPSASSAQPATTSTTSGTQSGATSATPTPSLAAPSVSSVPQTTTPAPSSPSVPSTATVPVVTTPTPSSGPGSASSVSPPVTSSTPSPSAAVTSPATSSGPGSGSSSSADTVAGETKSGSSRGPSQESLLQKQLKSLSKRRNR